MFTKEDEKKAISAVFRDECTEEQQEAALQMIFAAKRAQFRADMSKDSIEGMVEHLQSSCNTPQDEVLYEYVEAVADGVLDCLRRIINESVSSEGEGEGEEIDERSIKGADNDRLRLPFLLRAWWKRYEDRWVRVQDIMELCEEHDGLMSHILDDGSTRSKRTRLGIFLSDCEGGTFNGFRILVGRDKHAKANEYRIEEVSS